MIFLKRGFFYEIALLIVLVACTMLIAKSHGSLALFSNLIYSATVIGLYSICVLYHCHIWGQRTYKLLKALDHAAIFGLIAGSATPLCLLGLNNAAGWYLFSVMWIIALTGMILVIFNVCGKWTRVTLYIALGWFAIPYLSEIKSALGVTNFGLLIAGGLFYTVGALIYAFKRPDPFPRIFGYHEIFHVFVVIATMLHFIIIYSLV